MPAMARPTGDAGVSRISSDAGRNCSAVRSWLRRTSVAVAPPSQETTCSPPGAVLWNAALQPVQGGIAPGVLHQLVVGAVLDEPPALDGDDAIGGAHRREPMGDDQHRAPVGDLAHVALDDVFTLVIQRAGRLVENQDLRIGDERAGNRDTLALALPTGWRRARQPRCCNHLAARE